MKDTTLRRALGEYFKFQAGTEDRSDIFRLFPLALSARAMSRQGEITVFESSLLS